MKFLSRPASLLHYAGLSAFIMIAVGAFGFFVSQYLVDKSKRENEISHLIRAAKIIDSLAKTRGEEPNQVLKNAEKEFPGFIPPLLMMVNKEGELWSQQVLPPHINLQEILKEAPEKPLQVKILSTDSNVAMIRFDSGDVLFRFIRFPRHAYPHLPVNEFANDDPRKGIHISHPVVFGMTPERANTILFASILFLGFGLCVWFCVMLFRSTANEATRVISELHSGNLRARFPKSFGEVGVVAGKFNEMADEIEELIRRLKQSEESRQDLVNGLAHDLRTPVASLLSNLETIRDRRNVMSEENLSDFVETSVSEIKYLDALVNDLLLISGVSDAHIISRLQALELEEVIGEEVQSYVVRGIEIKLKANESMIILGDRRMLKRMIRNALDNATSFAKSKIDIHIYSENRHLILKVQDDGPGLSEEALRYFGTRFSSRKLAKDNSGRISIGLGSTIMKKICHLHGGDLLIENHSEDGKVKGAVLKFQLPLY